MVNEFKAKGSRYIKRRMGDELKNKILIHNGIIDKDIENKKIAILKLNQISMSRIH